MTSLCNYSSLKTPEFFKHYDGCYPYIEQLRRNYSFCAHTLDHQQQLQQTLGAPMLWIGIYVASASLVCLLAMAADTFQGFRKKTFWFPCKFFTLNAASLTLLAVAMKLPLDLSNPLESNIDQLSRLTSTVFMCIIMGNFMPSLGSMDNREIVMNLAALVILVITILVNVAIQLGTGAIFRTWVYQVPYYVAMILTFMLLVILSVTSLAVPTLRKILELKYSEIHKVASNEDLEQENGMITVEKLKEKVAKYWTMAKTGSPQFVITRSATCFASGAICFLVSLVLVGSDIIWGFWYMNFNSDYKWSTIIIFVIQSIAVVVGTIASTSRWFTATISTCSKKKRNLSQNKLKVENYWIQKLLEWKESPLALQIRNKRLRKLTQNTKSIILDFCITAQKVTVVASKVIQSTSVFFVSPVFSFCYYCKKLKKLMSGMNCPEDNSRADLRAATNLDLSRYVLKLEGEEELPESTLKNISDSLNHVIQMANKQQPKNMLELLKISKGFKGVAQFNSDQVPSLLSEEPPNCWSLAVVTLTTIAISLPNISIDLADRLLSSVSEGLSYVRLIEKCQDTKGKFVNLGKAAEVVWLRVELYRKWLDKDLREMSLKGKTSLENLVLLTGIASKTIIEFKGKLNGGQNKDLVDWPVMVIAANEMYRISQTLLLGCQERNEPTDETLFEQLSVMIAEILAACLTNLPGVITMKCYCSSIVEREESVKIAARLLGETEEILEILQQLQLPSLNADQLVFLDEWRVIVSQPNPSGKNSSFGNETDTCGSSEVQIAVEEV